MTIPTVRVDIVVDPIGGPTFDDALGVGDRRQVTLIGFAGGGCCTDPQGQPAGAQYQRGGRRVGEYLNAVPGSAALFAGAKPTGLSGAQTAPPQRYPLSHRPRCAESDDGGVLGKAVLF